MVSYKSKSPVKGIETLQPTLPLARGIHPIKVKAP